MHAVQRWTGVQGITSDLAEAIRELVRDDDNDVWLVCFRNRGPRLRQRCTLSGKCANLQESLRFTAASYASDSPSSRAQFCLTGSVLISAAFRSVSTRSLRPAEHHRDCRIVCRCMRPPRCSRHSSELCRHLATRSSGGPHARGLEPDDGDQRHGAVRAKPLLCSASHGGRTGRQDHQHCLVNDDNGSARHVAVHGIQGCRRSTHQGACSRVGQERHPGQCDRSWPHRHRSQ